jgi:hypothetical protein
LGCDIPRSTAVESLLRDCAGFGETLLAEPFELRGIFSDQSSHACPCELEKGGAAPRRDNRRIAQKSPALISYGDLLLRGLNKVENFKLKKSV